jgi:dephospho-CoA kinase
MKKLENRPALTAIDAIGLFEGGYDKLCDVTVTVTAPESDRVARLMRRDGITAEYALTRIRAQKSPETYSSLCDRTLVNDGTLEDFQKKCLAYLQDLGIINL